MQHRYNRSAFSRIAPESPLVRSYLRLIAIELALKDADPVGNKRAKHDVEWMITSRGDPTLNGLVQQVGDGLVCLHCKGVDGNPARVRRSVYPELRYVRHVSDFAPPNSAENDLIALADAVDRLADELQRRGLLP